jgi:hypothetical protein
MASGVLTGNSKNTKEKYLELLNEDIDTIFEHLTKASFNTNITAHSVSFVYNEAFNAKCNELGHKEESKYEVSPLHGALEKFYNELCLAALENADKSSEVGQSKSKILPYRPHIGITQKEFKAGIKQLEEGINSTTNTKDREEMIRSMEKLCVEICNNNPETFSKLLNLSTVLNESEVKQLMDMLR